MTWNGKAAHAWLVSIAEEHTEDGLEDEGEELRAVAHGRDTISRDELADALAEICWWDADDIAEELEEHETLEEPTEAAR